MDFIALLFAYYTSSCILCVFSERQFIGTPKDLTGEMLRANMLFQRLVIFARRIIISMLFYHMSKSLADYAEKNEVKKLQELLEKCPDINKYEYDKTALHSACVSNAIEAAKLLVINGIDVNLQDQVTKAVPLHYCAIYNHFEIASLILNNGGRLNIPDQYGNEPLWTAVFNVKGKLERLPFVELYLKHGADKNHKNDAGRRPVDFAKQVQFVPLLDILDKY